MAEYIKDVYSRMNHAAFWTCLGISLFLLVGAALTPPAFVIDASIFAATGELFAFATLATVINAIDKGTDFKFTRGDTTIHVDNPDNKEE